MSITVHDGKHAGTYSGLGIEVLKKKFAEDNKKFEEDNKTSMNKKAIPKIDVMVIGQGQLGNALFKFYNKICRDMHSGDKEMSYKLTVQQYRGRVDELDVMGGDFRLIDDEHVPTVFINTVSVTNTRECQKDWASTARVNTEFPIRLAHHLDKHLPQAKLIHISTGCLFDGNDAPSFEGATPTPLIDYAKQKHMAEIVADIHENTVILRPRMTFSDKELSSNLIWKVNNFFDVLTELNSMTALPDLVNVIHEFVQNDKTGTYNVVNRGMSSPYEIKGMIQRRWLRDDFEFYNPISKEELHKKTRMNLTNTWLDSDKLEKIYKMPFVHDRLAEAIDNATWLGNGNGNEMPSDKEMS